MSAEWPVSAVETAARGQKGKWRALPACMRKRAVTAIRVEAHAPSTPLNIIYKLTNEFLSRIKPFASCLGAYRLSSQLRLSSQRRWQSVQSLQSEMNRPWDGAFLQCVTRI
ncbi:hypothetical protein EVAR_22903_1 [Eumeta japonica]|uniref:Uncharacterized protein n=1 Tax=Eumeta variegata TaxID=151549 RepID=A0A4C1UU28_EUMVA|nr:hypothetical protein EVAR_22903_1 [Eumeta japonica]